MKKTKSNPAPYSTTDEQEITSVHTFENLIDSKRIRTDIRERDKYPNIDGYMELIDENRSPVGKLEVQIRTVHGENPKIQCPLSLFDYSEITCNPVLFIGVETDLKKAYWIHVTKGFLNEESIDDNQKTILISFPPENIVSEKNDSYIKEWAEIVQAYREIRRDYPQLVSLYKEISNKSNPLAGAESNEFSEMHVFLDRLNDLLDKKFRIVKQILYPNAWKIGLAFNDQEGTGFVYTLYPIGITMNDVQIKKLDDVLQEQLRQEGLAFTSYAKENPIKSRPLDHAAAVIQYETLRAAEHRLLRLDNEFLAREFIFAFTDHFAVQMGLDRKDTYSLAEVGSALYRYLPLWVEEAIKFIVKIGRNRVVSGQQLLYGRGYFDPDRLLCQIIGEEREQIHKIVAQRVMQGDRRGRVLLGSDKFPFRTMVESLRFLRSKQLEKIERPYARKDFSRLKGGTGWVWNVFSPEMVETNLKIFFDNLPKAYADFVSCNFPELGEDLPLFDGASLVIVSFDVRNTYSSFADSPRMVSFHWVNESDGGIEIELYKEGSGQMPAGLSSESVGRDLEIRGKKYHVISSKLSVLDFIYEDLPMFGMVYDELVTNLKNYFNSLRKPLKNEVVPQFE